ncbi:MAG: FdtA/QdtA family cupin domain-containing protein [Acidimicrobiales bacterium]
MSTVVPLDASDSGIVSRASGATPVSPPSEASSVPCGGAVLYRLPRHDDDRGTIVVGEAPSHLPFRPERVFLVRNVPVDNLRGDHAHRRCHQLIIATAGSVVVVVDDGVRRRSVRLDSPDLMLHVPPMVWSIQRDFDVDAQVLVMASEPYDRSEYVTDYDEFLRLVGRRAPG